MKKFNFLKTIFLLLSFCFLENLIRKFFCGGNIGNSNVHQSLAPIIPIAISAGITAAQMISSAIQKRKARQALENLQQQPLPGFSVAPEIQQQYTQAMAGAKYGYSPEETAAFNEQLARQQGTLFQSAVDLSGGNLAGAIGRGIKSQNIGALNTFASQGAQLQQQKFRYAGNIAQQLQQQQNMADQAKIQRRLLLEQMYGGAMKQQQENIYAGMGGLAAMGTQYALGESQRQMYKDMYPEKKRVGEESGVGDADFASELARRKKLYLPPIIEENPNTLYR